MRWLWSVSKQIFSRSTTTAQRRKCRLLFEERKAGVMVAEGFSWWQRKLFTLPEWTIVIIYQEWWEAHFRISVLCLFSLNHQQCSCCHLHRIASVQLLCMESLLASGKVALTLWRRTGAAMIVRVETGRIEAAHSGSIRIGQRLIDDSCQNFKD